MIQFSIFRFNCHRAAPPPAHLAARGRELVGLPRDLPAQRAELRGDGEDLEGGARQRRVVREALFVAVCRYPKYRYSGT